jgi:hypothetical protein
MSRMTQLLTVVLVVALTTAGRAQSSSADAFAAVNLPSFADRMDLGTRDLEGMPAGAAKEEAVQIRSHLQGWLEQARSLAGTQREKADTFKLNCLMMFIRSALADLESRLSPANAL